MSTVRSRRVRSLSVALVLVLAAGAAGQKPAPVAPEAPATPAAPKAKTGIKVAVKKPDGKPAAGAKVWVWVDEKKQAEGTTDANGQVELAVPMAFPSATVFASAPGFAPDWVEVKPAPDGARPNGAPVALELAEGGPPIEARLTDLEGRPLANLPVEVTHYAKLKAGQTWGAFREKNAADEWNSLPRVRPAAVGLHDRLVTDKDGRVKLSGVGRDRFVSFITRGESHEHVLVRVVCRKLEPSDESPGRFPLCGATGTVPLAPARALTGTVRDAKTGAPVPGMRVKDVRTLAGTTSDKDGKFTLHGVKKQKEYWVLCGSAGDAPYFGSSAKAQDTPGFDPVTLELKVHRGVILTGRVADEKGKPVSGRIFYDWTEENPHLKDYPELDAPSLAGAGWNDLDREGRYKVLAVPGPAALGVCGLPEDRYPRLDTRKELTSRGVLSGPVGALHAVSTVNVDPKDPKTLVHDFTLEGGKSRRLLIEGLDGKLPAKLLAVGHTDSAEPKPVVGGVLTLSGLSSKRTRAIILMDEAKTLGAVAAVSGDGEGPVTVKLEKLGSLAGRVLDSEGKPAAGAEVRLWLQLSAEKYEILPSELRALTGFVSVERGAWQTLTGRTVKADKEGRFTISGVLPGQEYRLVAGFNLENQGGELLHQKSGVTVKPGQAHDLGDLKAQK